MKKKAVEITGLKKTYSSGTQALKDINLEIESGDFFALLGANGAGKTTTIGIMTSLVNPTGGTVKIFGHDIVKSPDEAKKMVGVVPQEFNFNFFEKVIDIVVWQSGYFGIPRKTALKRAEKILKALELWDKKDTQAMKLSGGMKRRLMIARALVHKPKLLILDEPTAGVDVELRHGMWKYLKELNKEGTTILLTTHYLEEVEQLCRNVAMIKDGTIIEQDSVKNALSSLENQTYIADVSGMKKGTKMKNYDIKMIDKSTLEVDLKADQPISDFIVALQKNGISVNDIRTKGNRMEQLFLNLLHQPSK